MKKAVFLDRDGIINIDKHYVYKIEDFEFSNGIFELLKHLQDLGYLLFIVTNQSGIGREYYTLEDFNKLTSFMLNKLEEEQIKISQVEYCPHLPNENCLCRKPNTAMIDKILENFHIDLENSWFIGDKDSDMQCALNAKIKNRIKVHNNLEELFQDNESYFECKNIKKIHKIIIK